MQKPDQHLHLRQITPIVSALVIIGLLCYGFAFSLPLFWDDIFQFLWLEPASMNDIWAGPAAGLGYYRPIAFSLWKVARAIQGTFHAPTLHGANIVLHLINASLIACIVILHSRHRRILTGFTTATLFLLFPFSVQAIAPVNSLMHPLHTTLLLSGILAYLRSVDTSRLSLRLIALLLTCAAILAHENGVVAPALITITALSVEPRKPIRHLVMDVLPFWILAFLTFLFWRGRSGQSGLSMLGTLFAQPESRLQNAVYFFQALTYPLSPLAKNVAARLAIHNDLVAVCVVSVPCIFAIIVWARHAGRGISIAWGLAWFFITALPACLMLSFNYVIESPRLLYLSSVGISMVWAAPVGFTCASRTAGRLSQFLALLLVVSAGVWGYHYIQRRASLYVTLGQALEQVHQGVAISERCALATRESILLVNYPDWYFTRDAEYLIGHDGIATVSTGDRFENVYRVNVGDIQRFTYATLPDTQPKEAIFVSMGPSHTYDSLQASLRSANAIIANTADNTGVSMRFAGCLRTERQEPNDLQYQALFGERLLVLDSSAEYDAARGELRITMDWLARTADLPDTTMFVHLIDRDGNLIGQSDGYPLAGSSPPQLWQAGDVWRDVRILRLNGGLPRGGYRVVAGAYVTANTERLPAMSANGQRLPEDVLVLSVTNGD